MTNDSEVHAADSAEDEGRVGRPYQGAPANVPTAPPVKVPTYPMSSMRTSPRGLAFMTSVEGGGSNTDRLQSPGNGSGVTIGLGYDLHGQNPRDIVSDLTSIGIDRKKAEYVLSAHRAVGRDADKFVKDNQNLIFLTNYQKQALLQKTIGRYEKILKDTANFPVTQYQFDALVALTYNSGGPLSVITKSIASGNFVQAEKDWLSRSHSRLHGKAYSMKGLLICREREVKLYKTGVYN